MKIDRPDRHPGTSLAATRRCAVSAKACCCRRCCSRRICPAAHWLRKFPRRPGWSSRRRSPANWAAGLRQTSAGGRRSVVQLLDHQRTDLAKSRDCRTPFSRRRPAAFAYRIDYDAVRINCATSTVFLPASRTTASRCDADARAGDHRRQFGYRQPAAEGGHDALGSVRMRNHRL